MPKHTRLPRKIEFIENKPVALVSDNITEQSLSTIMTNFSNTVFKQGIIQNYGSGYERYEETKAAYDDTPATMDGMKRMMQKLWYTKAYTSEQNTPGFRYSDIIPDNMSFLDLTNHPEWKTENQEMIDYINNIQDQFINRKGWYTEDCPLWYTTHSSVYDIKARRYQIILHEGIRLLPYIKYYSIIYKVFNITQNSMQ